MGDMSLFFFFLTELEGLRPYRNFIKNKEETEGTKVLPPGLGNKKKRKKMKLDRRIITDFGSIDQIKSSPLPWPLGIGCEFPS
jgi:hypothetical protein